MKKKLYRSSRGKIIAGVCTGLGEYFEIDPVLIRALFIIALFSGGIGLLLYVVMWMIMPKEEAVFSPLSPTESSETDESVSGEKPRGAVVTGLLLVGLGAFFFIREFLPEFNLEYVLPMALMAIGTLMIFNALRKNLTSSKP